MDDAPQPSDTPAPAPGGTTEGAGDPTNVSSPEVAAAPADPKVPTQEAAAEQPPAADRPVEQPQVEASAEPLPADMTVAQSAASVAQIEDSRTDPDAPTLAPVPDMILPAADLSDDEKNDLVIPMFQSHQRVRALKIAKVHFSTVVFEDDRFMARTMRDFVEKHSPESGGWYIVHSDGAEDYYPSSFESDFHPVG